MRNLNKQPSINCLEVPQIGVNHGGHWSDDESELPPAKRARDNGYSSDHTAITDYEDMWSQQHMDNRNVILTPPSLVCELLVLPLCIIFCRTENYWKSILS